MSTMHAASRQALAGAEQRLLEATDGAGGDEVTGLARDMFGIAELLDSESALRRAVADTATAPQARVNLVRSLVDDRVSARAHPVVTGAVSDRWSSPRDLVNALEYLGHVALLVRADRENRLDAVEDELFRLGRIVAGQPELDRLLSDPTGDRDGRIQVVDTLIGGKVEPVTIELVHQLAARPHGDIVAGLEQLAGLAAKRRERSIAHVRSATPLDSSQQERLEAVLERIYARPIALHLEIEPGLMGGLVIQIGDEVIDGSTSGRLNSLRRALAD